MFSGFTVWCFLLGHYKCSSFLAGTVSQLLLLLLFFNHHSRVPRFYSPLWRKQLSFHRVLAGPMTWQPCGGDLWSKNMQNPTSVHHRRPNRLLSGSLQQPPGWPPCPHPCPLGGHFQNSNQCGPEVRRGCSAAQGLAGFSISLRGKVKSSRGPPWPGPPLHIFHCPPLSSPFWPHHTFPVPSAWSALRHARAWLLPPLLSVFILECHLLNETSLTILFTIISRLFYPEL